MWSLESEYPAQYYIIECRQDAVLSFNPTVRLKNHIESKVDEYPSIQGL